MHTKISVCPHCGKNIENENLIVCLNCGHEIYSVSTPPPKKHNLFSAYKAMFTKMFDFRSRSGRAEYWYAYLANLIILFLFAFALIGVDYIAATDLDSFGNIKEIYKTVFDVINYISIVYSLVLLIPQLSLIIRRLHDTNRSAMYALLLLAAPLGSIILIWFFTQKGTNGVNRYGNI